ncbi:hypothetical protein JHN59_42535, partial [Streptomyces sp. MBT49]|uniref:hypothetical protein n=1 Tax=Streptomyces sp. MBT49 TaxID=1488380 RepID=UPI00190E20E8
DHPDAPGLLVLSAIGIIGVVLFAAAAVLLVVTVATAARYLRRRATAVRRARDTYAAAIARVRAGHDQAPDGTCTTCHVPWPCYLLCRLAGGDCGNNCTDRHGIPADPAPPRPHRAIVAAALDDWWRTADPAATFDGET